MFADICSVLCYVSRFVMESSYVPVESLIFGRLAYKGMNAEIESLMLEVRSTYPLIGSYSDLVFFLHQLQSGNSKNIFERTVV